MEAEIERFFLKTSKTALARFHPELRESLSTNLRAHGRTAEWSEIVTDIEPADIEPSLTSDTIHIGSATKDYNSQLQALKPWRKGPWQIGRTYVDAEWRSDWKWQRVKPHIDDLQGKQVLDIGCGNGYHLFRMLGDGASLALGIDPTILFNFQFALLQRLSSDNQAFLLPLRAEHLPEFRSFDLVFSMGVLYHRRSPLDHLQELLGFLRPGGQLVLETLIIEGDPQQLLIPRDRYAKMANVWFIPSTGLLEKMVSRIGFTSTRLVDVTTTSLEEQRRTPWMNFESLADFLDARDRSKTVEGYPAPIRAILTAEKPI